MKIGYDGQFILQEVRGEAALLQKELPCWQLAALGSNIGSYIDKTKKHDDDDDHNFFFDIIFLKYPHMCMLPNAASCQQGSSF